MAVKLRLQRHGKKGKPFYHVVAADARSKRDGKYIEKVGTYNPNVNPAVINLDFDRALYWVKNGAIPTDTCRGILSYKGVLMKDHLDRGVLKGALTQEQADAKFQAWLDGKGTQIQSKIDGLNKANDEAKAAALKAEKEVNDKRAADIAAKNAELAAEAEAAAKAETAEEAPAEEAEGGEEAPAAE